MTDPYEEPNIRPWLGIIFMSFLYVVFFICGYMMGNYNGKVEAKQQIVINDLTWVESVKKAMPQMGKDDECIVNVDSWYCYKRPDVLSEAVLTK